MKKWTEEYDVDQMVVHRDEDILVLNKPAGVLTQSDIEGDYSIHKHFCKKHRKTYHLVNRVDRPVSGLLVLAANPKYVKELMKPDAFIKSYLAVTNVTEEKEQELVHYVKRDGKAKKAWVSDHSSEGLKKAVLDYKVVKSFDNYELVEVNLKTGRFHQIRAQLAEVGRCIKGDVKYGARRGNRDRSIDLHAFHLRLPDKGLIFNVKANREGGLWKEIDAYIDSLD